MSRLLAPGLSGWSQGTGTVVKSTPECPEATGQYASCHARLAMASGSRRRGILAVPEVSAANAFSHRPVEGVSHDAWTGVY
jgi:hypothetical protein